jgi:4'-phosphopantetheinyl transferase
MNSTTGTVVVWRIDLTAEPASGNFAFRCLTPEELARSSHFRFEADRRRFALRRAARRIILSRHLDVAPTELQFSAGPHGKPCLSGPLATSPIAFNCTSSMELALIAIAGGGDLGIDLERHREMDADLRHVVESFSTSERSLLRGCSGPVGSELFFRLWTRKEAVLKARGSGLTSWLPELEVSPPPRSDPMIPCPIRDPDGIRTWRVSSLNAAPGFSAALACDRLPEISVRDWSW